MAQEVAPEWTLKSPQTEQTHSPTISAPLTFSAEDARTGFYAALAAYNDKDYADALTLAQAAGALGDADAMAMAGHILLRGEAGEVDPKGALDWFKEAAKQNQTDAFVALGEMALRGHEGLAASEALSWFTKAANDGRVDAMRALGEMYLKGRGVPMNVAKGNEWLEKAEDNGETRSARKLADSLFDTNPQKALDYYEKAAAQGDHESAYIAAIMYAENVNVRPNQKRMTALLAQAAKSGHAAAQADYGLLVYQGAGVAQSNEAAAKWFEKSAKGGDAEGQFLYAFTLAKGEGVTQSFEDAYYWLLKAGTSNSTDYQKDRDVLKKRLEDNVDPAILAKARARFERGG